MPLELFVDESERRDYMLCAVTVNARDLSARRIALRRMLLPGERRMHFAKETVSRRRQLLDRIAREDFAVGIFACRARETIARPLLLRAVVETMPDDVSRFVIESRTHDDHRDRSVLADLQREGRFPAGATYEHLLATEEPLLWVSDAIAWAWGAGGDYRRRIAHIVARVVSADP